MVKVYLMSKHIERDLNGDHFIAITLWSAIKIYLLASIATTLAVLLIMFLVGWLMMMWGVILY